MKKRMLLATCVAVVLVGGLLSCKKRASASGGGSTTDCISDQTVTLAAVDTLITPQAMDVAVNLFQKNNLSTAYQQFFSVDSNYFIPPGYTTEVDQVNVLSNRWYNNLPLFRWNDNITFYNGVFQPQASILFTGSAPGPDVSFHQSLEALQSIWVKNFMRVGIYGPLLNDTVPSHPDASYSDSCLIAKRGYIDAGYFSSQAISYTGQLIKAWTVTPLNGTYPMLVIADNTGVAWPSNVYLP